MKYGIIVCDPPWDYKGQRQHAGKNKSDTGGALTHYKTMTTPDMITTFKPIIEDWRDNDCLLFMWTTWPHLDQAITLGTAWGFKYVHTPFIWDKMRTNPGYYTLTETEPVLCFKYGRIPKPRGTRNERQLIREQRTQHSTKPQELYTRIERMWPTLNKMEMFARQPRTNWHVFGDEL